MLKRYAVYFLPAIIITLIITACGDDAAADKKSSNAALASLTLSSGVLSPAFDPAGTAYSASTLDATVTVTPSTADAKATITVNDASTASGTTSSAIALAYGTNVITVTVTAEDGTGLVYTLTITRHVNMTGAWKDMITTANGIQTMNFILTQDASGAVSYIFSDQSFFHDITGTVSGAAVNLTVTDASNNLITTISGMMKADDTLDGTASMSFGSAPLDVAYAVSRLSNSTDIPALNIPAATITVDGTITDWSAITAAMSDATGDTAGSGPAGSDIEWVKFAANASRLYYLVKLNGVPDPDSKFYIYLKNYSLSGNTYSKSIGWHIYNDTGSWMSDVNDATAPAAASGVYLEGSADTSLMTNSTNETLAEPFIFETFQTRKRADGTFYDTFNTFVGLVYLP